MTTKVHARVDGKGRLFTVGLTPGQQQDVTMAETLLQHGAVRSGKRGRPRLRPKRFLRRRAIQPIIGQLEFLDFSDPSVGLSPLLNIEAVYTFIDAVMQSGQPPKLIIIDTLTWALDGGDVMSQKDAQTAINNCKVI